MPFQKGFSLHFTTLPLGRSWLVQAALLQCYKVGLRWSEGYSGRVHEHYVGSKYLTKSNADCSATEIGSFNQGGVQAVSGNFREKDDELV